MTARARRESATLTHVTPRTATSGIFSQITATAPASMAADMWSCPSCVVPFTATNAAPSSTLRESNATDEMRTSVPPLISLNRQPYNMSFSSFTSREVYDDGPVCRSRRARGDALSLDGADALNLHLQPGAF